MNLISNVELVEKMDIVRKVCGMIASLRNKHNLPIKLRLPEVQITIDGDKNKDFLLKEFREIIADESNIEFVEPFISDEKYNEDYVEELCGDIKIKLNTNYTPGAWQEYQSRKEYSIKMSEEKEKGTYNEFTYKKYKTKV